MSPFPYFYRMSVVGNKIFLSVFGAVNARITIKNQQIYFVTLPRRLEYSNIMNIMNYHYENILHTF